jgi:hypothetical protein
MAGSMAREIFICSVRTIFLSKVARHPDQRSSRSTQCRVEKEVRYKSGKWQIDSALNRSFGRMLLE